MCMGHHRRIALGREEVETTSVAVHVQLHRAALEDAIARLTSPGCSVILDLTGLTFVDGSGDRSIIKAWNTSGQRVVLLNPSPSSAGC